MIKQMGWVGCVALATMALADIDLENVPDVKPYANRVYGIRKVEQKDGTTLRVILGATATGAMTDTTAWRIVSDDDPAYAYEKFVQPTKVTLVETKMEFPYPKGREMNSRGSTPLERSIVDLTLPSQMKKGCDYAAVAYGTGNNPVTAALTGSRVGSPDGDTWAARLIGLRKVSSVGDGKLLCEFGAGYSEQGGNTAANWSVTVNGQKRPVRALGRRTKLDFYKTSGWPYGGVLLSDVFLDIGDTLKNGDKVVVTVTDAVTCGERSARMTFDDKKSITRSIQANQVGYRTDGVKVAYVGCWMGSMPDKNFVGGEKSSAPTSVDTADYFGLTAEKTESAAMADGKSDAYHKLHDGSLRLDGSDITYSLIDAASGKTVHTGPVKLIHDGTKPEGKVSSGGNVWEIDFTVFTKTGTYFLSVPGVGRSLEFVIGPEAYRKAFKVQAQGVYCQRCGIAIDPKLSGGWKRIACHKDGIVPTEEKRYQHGEWGDFKKTQATIPNPDKAALDAKKATVLKQAVTDSTQLSTNPAGLGMTGVVPPMKDGLSFVFTTKRDDSFGGNKWGGSIFAFSEEITSAIIFCNWGIPTLRGGGAWKRYGDKKDHVFALTFTPPEGKTKFSTCSWYVDGELIATAQRYYPFKRFYIGNILPENAQGTTFSDIQVYAKILSQEEIKTLATEIPERIPRRIKAYGGHHDAGDYNPRSHMDVAQRLLELYELQPQKFTDGQLNVPERGNGIPDVVDEALWQLRLYIGLQDKEDGGVPYGTESQGDPHFYQTVELDDKGDYAWAKDSYGSYLSAGAFAQASRILMKCGKKKEAAAFLKRAEKAYAWAVANPPTDMKSTQSLGRYTISSRAYAAVSLYHTTGKASYHEDFKKNCPWMRNPRADLSVHNKYDMEFSARQYLLLPEDLRDKALWRAILDAFKREYNMFVNGCKQSPYKILRNPFAPITWGTGAYENFAINAGFYYVVTGDASVRDWLIRTADNTLGANPMSISWVTGLGQRTMRCPLHNCRYRPDGLPVAGLQAQGPMMKGEGYSYHDTVYPRNNEWYANMHTWIDTHFAIVMDEPTVNNMVNTMFVFGLLTE